MLGWPFCAHFFGIFIRRENKNLASGDVDGTQSYIENIALIDPRYTGPSKLRNELTAARRDETVEKPDIEIIYDVVER